MNKLAEIRAKKNISMSELSKKSGVSERYLRFIEKGERNPSIKTLKAIATVLECSLDDLL